MHGYLLFLYLILIPTGLPAEQEKSKMQVRDTGELFEHLLLAGLTDQEPKTFLQNDNADIKTLKSEIESAEKNSNTRLLADKAALLGHLFLWNNHPEDALNFFLKSLDGFRQLNDKKSIARYSAEAGLASFKLNKNEKALQYFYTALEFSREENLWLITAWSGGLTGIIYLQKNDRERAGKYLKESEALFEKINNANGAALIAILTGEQYLLRNMLSDAMDRFLFAIEKSTPANDRLIAAVACRNMGIACFRKGDYDKALGFFNKSVQHSNSLITQKLIKETYIKLATFLSFNSRFDDADHYHYLYRQLKDSLEKQSHNNRLNRDERVRAETMKQKVIRLLNPDVELQGQKLQKQELELSRQLTTAELERIGKEKAIEELNLLLIEKKEKENELYRLSKEKAERELELSRKQLQLNKQNDLLYALAGLSVIVVVTLFFLYNRYRYKRKSNETLSLKNEELRLTLEKLKNTQDQLVHSQKMASLGELTAGIAHEIQNPLNFVTNFSSLSLELMNELPAADESAKQEIMEMLRTNVHKISEHGKRADKIIKGMLLHSRSAHAEKLPADLNKVVENALELSITGFRSTHPDFDCNRKFHPGNMPAPVTIIQQDISRVLVNIITNSLQAMAEKKNIISGNYKPELVVKTLYDASGAEILIHDNGPGILPELKEKIFNPFFSTKPAGMGTGLGLSISYDIITKGHNGTIEVDSAKDEFTEFRIFIPSNT